VRRQQRWEI